MHTQTHTDHPNSPSSLPLSLPPLSYHHASVEGLYGDDCSQQTVQLPGLPPSEVLLDRNGRLVGHRVLANLPASEVLLDDDGRHLSPHDMADSPAPGVLLDNDDRPLPPVVSTHRPAAEISLDREGGAFVSLVEQKHLVLKYYTAICHNVSQSQADIPVLT